MMILLVNDHICTVLLILFTTCLGVVEVVCVADVDKSVLVDNLVEVLITFSVLCTENGIN